MNEGVSVKDPNILFIVVDALRAKNLGCYGYSQPISPNIDDLSKEGVLFEDAFSCSNCTDASLTTIFSGKYPLSHGILSNGLDVKKEDIQKLYEYGIRFLPEILKSKGYTTLAVDWIGRWHRRGYDYYSSFLHEASPRSLSTRWMARFDEVFPHTALRRFARLKKSTVIDEAHLVTAHAEEMIKKYHAKKFFLFIHYWDTHHPYAPPTGFYEKIDTESIGKLLERMANFDAISRLWKVWTIQEKLVRYDASIAYVDHHIGRLVESLQKYGILDQTVVVFTSDHGESLTEHGIYFFHHALYDVTIRVPLILRYSDLPRNSRIRGFTQHFDIVPTLLDILGIKYRDFDGKSAIPLIYGETDQLHSAIYAEEALHARKRAVRTNDYKYIYALSKKKAVCRRCRRVHGDMEELYDLNEDPEENQNVLKEKSDVARKLKEELSQWIASVKPTD